MTWIGFPAIFSRLTFNLFRTWKLRTYKLLTVHGTLQRFLYYSFCTSVSNRCSMAIPAPPLPSSPSVNRYLLFAYCKAVNRLFDGRTRTRLHSTAAIVESGMLSIRRTGVTVLQAVFSSRSNFNNLRSDQHLKGGLCACVQRCATWEFVVVSLKSQAHPSGRWPSLRFRDLLLIYYWSFRNTTLWRSIQLLSDTKGFRAVRRMWLHIELRW